VPIVLAKLVVLTESVDHVVLALPVKFVSEVSAHATEAVLERSADLITVEPSVEPVYQDKPVIPMESVLVLVLPNVLDLMEPSELVDGIVAMPTEDVEPAPTPIPATSDAETELASVSPTVTTSTAVMTVVVDLVEPAKVEPSAKDQVIPSPTNVTSTATLRSELRLESSRPTIWCLKHAQSP